VFSLVIGIIGVFCLAGFLIGRQRVIRQTAAAGARSHSLPDYYGLYVALWTGIPSILLVLAWLAAQGGAVDRLLLASLADSAVAGKSPAELSLLLTEIRSVASGRIFGQPSQVVIDAASRLNLWQALAGWGMVAAGSALALLGLFVTRRKIAPEFRARQGVERIISALMMVSALAAILTTFGILLSLLFEAFRFFDRVPIGEFLFGLNWEPQIPLREDQVAGHGAFGAVPVFTGTLLVALIAMSVAMPVGLFAAIYTSEYADRRVRAVVKPIMEVLAGIPTIVYGFFAVLIVAPALREFGRGVGLDVAPNSALAAGAVMGVMILPFISSITDDALSAVPNAMREGAYGLGATKAETIVQVLLPAALPGIVGGVLLAVSRAIGETMIVVMAAGLIARLTANPLESVTTVTVQIVTLLIGDTEFDNPKTLAAFALGLVLFLSTLAMNITALKIVQKYREKYE
jgi:phosphate transport system permease protein